MKLCIIYNFAQKYREAIFREIDKKYDCKWFFGTNDTDIKGFDLSFLKDASLVQNKTFVLSPFYYQQNIPTLANKKGIDTFLVLGDPFCVSTWILSIRIKLFNRNKKLYYWTHGWYGKETLIRRLFKKVFFKMANGIFLYGNYAKQLMIKEGFDENKLFVIHNSLDYDNQIDIRKKLVNSDIYKNHFKNDNKTLIFIGRLTKVKRLDLLLDAIKILKDKGEEYNLILIGDGVERRNLEEKTATLELNENVWFYGTCYEDTKNAELIYNADLCVAPGNVGLTAMHTMVFGTPVITHDEFKFQMPEFEAIHEGITGGFFKYNDTISIVNCISSWFKSFGNQRESVRMNCYKEIEEQWNPHFQIKVINKHLK